MIWTPADKAERPRRMVYVRLVYRDGMPVGIVVREVGRVFPGVAAVMYEELRGEDDVVEEEDAAGRSG